MTEQKKTLGATKHEDKKEEVKKLKQGETPKTPSGPTASSTKK